MASSVADDDLRLQWLEVPITTSLGLVGVDAVAYSAARDLLVPAELKSGANVDEEQAAKYREMKVEDILRIVTVPGASITGTRMNRCTWLSRSTETESGSG